MPILLAVSRRSLLALWGVVAFLPGAAAPDAGAHSIEAAAGIHIPFGSRERTTYGAATAWSLGYSIPLTSDLTRSDVRLMVDVTYSSASGDPFANDPTFEFPEERYWFLPIVVGVRTNFVRTERQETIGLYGGLGFASVLSGYRDTNGQTYNTPTFGALFELRPELKVSRAVSIWIRQRILLAGNVEFGFRELDLSGAPLQLGLSYEIR